MTTRYIYSGVQSGAFSAGIIIIEDMENANFTEDVTVVADIVLRGSGYNPR